MKSYRPTRAVLADVERALAAHKPAQPGAGPLQRVAEILHEARPYAWIRIDLRAEEQALVQAAQGETASAALESQAAIKMVGRVIGALRVGSQEALRVEDRVLLKDVARHLAKFLTSRGKHLVRKVRESARKQHPAEVRGYQPSSEKAAVAEGRRVAAGEKS